MKPEIGSPAGGAAGEVAHAIPVRETVFASTWRGVVCPACGNMLAEGHLVVVCPKCLSPNHVECWRSRRHRCAACGTAAGIADSAESTDSVAGGARIEVPGQPGQPDQAGATAPAREERAIPAPGTPDLGVAAPTSLSPAPPTPSADTLGAISALSAEGAAAQDPPAAGARPTAEARVPDRRARLRSPAARRRWLVLKWSAVDDRAPHDIGRGMAVRDAAGRRLGVVAHVYRRGLPVPGDTGTVGGAGGTGAAKESEAHGTPGTHGQHAAGGDAVLDVKTGLFGLGRRLYVPVAAVHDVRADGLFLWKRRAALKGPELAAWRRRPAPLAEQERLPAPPR